MTEKPLRRYLQPDRFSILVVGSVVKHCVDPRDKVMEKAHLQTISSLPLHRQVGECKAE